MPPASFDITAIMFHIELFHRNVDNLVGWGRTEFSDGRKAVIYMA